MFSPNLGRWTSVDPIGFTAGDVDLYRTEGNNPTSRLDPSGLDDVTIKTKIISADDIESRISRSRYGSIQIFIDSKITDDIKIVQFIAISVPFTIQDNAKDCNLLLAANLAGQHKHVSGGKPAIYTTGDFDKSPIWNIDGHSSDSSPFYQTRDARSLALSNEAYGFWDCVFTARKSTRFLDNPTTIDHVNKELGNKDALEKRLLLQANERGNIAVRSLLAREPAIIDFDKKIKIAEGLRGATIATVGEPQVKFMTFVLVNGKLAKTVYWHPSSGSSPGKIVLDKGPDLQTIPDNLKKWLRETYPNESGYFK